VKTTFTPTVFVPYSTYRYHIYIALYYYLPNGPVTSQGHTYQCLDTQSRVENVNGQFSAVGTTSSYDAGDSFGYDVVSLGAVVINQTYTLSASVSNLCRQDLAAWNITSSTPCQLSGVEIGIEGFKFTELDVNFQSYAFIATPALITVVRGGSNMLYWSGLSSGSWTGWQSLGLSTAYSPALCTSGPGSVELVVVGSDNSVYHKSFTGGGWATSWDNGGGVTSYAPSCAVLNGNLYVAIVGGAGSTWVNSRLLATGSWIGWTNLGGNAVAFQPVLVASAGANRLDLLVVGGDNTVYHKSFVNNAWSTSWDNAAGMATSGGQ
jgi:hypothetical protein